MRTKVKLALQLAVYTPSARLHQNHQMSGQMKLSSRRIQLPFNACSSCPAFKLGQWNVWAWGRFLV